MESIILSLLRTIGKNKQTSTKYVHSIKVIHYGKYYTVIVEDNRKRKKTSTK